MRSSFQQFLRAFAGLALVLVLLMGLLFYIFLGNILTDEKALWEALLPLIPMALKMGALVGIIALALAIFFAKRLSQPIETLLHAVRDLASHEGSAEALPTSLAVSSPELALVHQSTLSLAQGLSSRIQALSQASEERIALLRGLKDGVLALTPQGRVSTLNLAAEDLLSIHEHARGALIFDLLKEKEIIAFLKNALQSDRVLETIIHLEKSTSKHLLLRATPLEGLRENMLLVLIRDVTHAIEHESLRQEFVANVSHELRTPITSIRGFIDIIRESKGDEKSRERFLSIIDRQSKRLLVIVEDLLTLSQIERQEETGSLPKDLVNLHELFEELKEELGPAFQKKSMHLILHCPKGLKVILNRVYIERALINLLTNALRYSKEGREVHLKADLNEELLLEVSDRGCGISLEDQERIFERFFVVDKARTRQAGGTGLGLSIVKHCASVHGGDAGVESQLGRGSRFWIRLPLEMIHQ